MNNKLKYIDLNKNSFDILMLSSVNLNQAIKCCAIIDAHQEIAEKDINFKNNVLFTEMINCTFRDLLMSVCRIYDEIKIDSCNIKELKKYIYNEPDYIFSKEEKKKISNMFKPLEEEYKNKYKIERDKKLAHTDYNNLYNFNRGKYTYKQIKEFVINTKKVFEYILSINKDKIPFYETESLKDKYIVLFMQKY